LVRWLGGEDPGLRRRLAERLLPQFGLAAKSLIDRSGASSPLDGGVKLTTFLASLLYPGDTQGERVLCPGLHLVQPKELLKDVVLTQHQRSQLEQFLSLCRASQGPGRAILLWGRAGTGKTLTAKALAGELGMPLLFVRAHDTLHEAGLIERAAAAAQIEGAALFFDECGRWLDSENRPGGPSPEASMLLQVLQDHPGVVIAAMNQGWLRMSDAFKRRFPTQICYGATESAHRAELWRRHIKRPVTDAILERTARLYDISGGFIKNASAQLNLGDPSLGASWEEIQSAVSTQLHASVEWEGSGWSAKDGRSALDADCRRSLQRLGQIWSKNTLLAHEDSHEECRGFKALFRGRVQHQMIGLAYLAQRLRRKAQMVYLSDLLPKDGQKGYLSPADLRRSAEACSLSNGLPVLRLSGDEFNMDGPARPMVRAFLGAGGFGVVSVMSDTRLPDFLQADAMGPWITLKAPKRTSLSELKIGTHRYRLEVKDAALEQVLLGMPGAKLQLLARWALAKQQADDPGKVPDFISEAQLRTALNNLTKPATQTPIF
jgi:DNA polymerase III delta prime subunit